MDGESSSHFVNHDDVILSIPFAMEPNVELDYELMDPILAQHNIVLIEKLKKAYDLNRNFKDTWVVKLPWAVSILSSNGKVVQVECKVCSLIEGKDKLLVPKLDSFWKHVGHLVNRKFLILYFDLNLD
jgi:hypothetical protein